jgi:hypothetical protein
MARSFASAGGTNNIATAINPTNLKLTGSLTVAGWAYPASFTGSPSMFCMDDGSGAFANAYTIGFNASGNVTYLSSHAGSSQLGIAGVVVNSTNTWVHVACSCNSGSLLGTLYVNGVADNGAQTILNPVYTGTPNGLFFGTQFSNGNFTNPLTGRLADCAVWSTNLTTLEILGLARGQRPYVVRRLSLVGYWPFDGLQSPEPELSGNAYNGTITGSIPFAFGPPMTLFTPRWPMGSLLITPVAANLPASFSILSNIVTQTEVISY